MENNDEFPVGMRVLAVDDDPVCLRVLRALLEKCRYNVTVTTKAVVALKLLREDKDKFDLIISDVRMPDMDGFKLLELVGLEMDLPVIMISAFSDTEAVMKGIAHGACDYLVKPVRLEEIKNVWQHVIRRQKSHPSQHKKCDQTGNSEKAICTDVAVSNDPSDGKTGLYRKRKDPDIAVSNDYDDEEEDDDECLENAETSTKKKPRVVWHIDLHSKFVAAVNQLGIEKAVPKKILELMNVEELTRENVASHLQKYRIFLKKMNDVSNCHDDILAALGSHNSSYLPMALLDDIYNRQALSGPELLSKFASFEKGVLARRLNSSNVTDGSSFGRQNVSSRFHFPAFPTSRMSHPDFIQNSQPYSVNNLAKLMDGSIHGSQHENLVKGLPSSLELLQQNKLCHEPVSVLPDSLPVVNNPAESFSSADSTYIQRFQAPHENKNFKVYGFDSRYVGDIPFTGNMENALPFSFPFTHGSLPPDSLKGNILDGNSSGTNLYSFPNSLTGRYSQKQSDTMNGSTLFLPTASSSSPEFVSIENICRPQERLESGDGLLETFVTHDSRFNTAVGTKIMDASFIGQQNLYVPFTSQNFDAARSSTDSRNGYEGVCVDPFKLLGGCNSRDQCSIDELLNAMDNQESGMHSNVDDLILDGK